VLDVGAGTGILARAVRAAAPSSPITGVELSREYVDFASRHTPDDRVHFQLGDARSLSFADATFDRALSLLVLNFVPEPAVAVAEMARVTRPGGRVAAAVWDYPGRMDMLRAFWDQAIALDPAAEPRDEGHLPLCRSGELAALWRRQGLDDVEEAPLNITLHFDSFDDYWTPFLLGQGPAGAHVASLSGSRQAELAQRLRAHLVGDSPDHPFDLPARAWAATGIVPHHRT